MENFTATTSNTLSTDMEMEEQLPFAQDFVQIKETFQQKLKRQELMLG